MSFVTDASHLASLILVAASAGSLASHNAMATTFVIPDVPGGHVVEIDMACDEERCAGPATLRVLHHGLLIHSFESPDFQLEASTDRAGTGSEVLLYREQNVVVAKDVNFDGRLDLAIRNGSHGSYGAPSYDIYLQGREQPRFLHHEELTALVATTLGLFTVDSINKRLIAHEKSGCCWHQTTHYGITKAGGIFITYAKTEAVTVSGEHVHVTTKRRVGKKLMSRTKVYRTEAYYK